MNENELLSLITDGLSEAAVKSICTAADLYLKYSPDQPRDEGGRWTDGGGGNSPQARPEPRLVPKPSPKPNRRPVTVIGDHHVSEATLGDFERMRELVWPNPYPKGTREYSAAQMLSYMDVADPMFMAKDKNGTFLGAINITHKPGELRVDFLAVNPRILTGQLKAKGVGTALMIYAAKLAASDDRKITLQSLDRQSDKFYQAIGMTRILARDREYEWTPPQVKKIAKEGKLKEDDFDVEAVIEAALEAEDENPPLAGNPNGKKEGKYNPDQPRDEQGRWTSDGGDVTQSQPSRPSGRRVFSLRDLREPGDWMVRRPVGERIAQWHYTWVDEDGRHQDILDDQLVSAGVPRDFPRQAIEHAMSFNRNVIDPDEQRRPPSLPLQVIKHTQVSILTRGAYRSLIRRPEFDPDKYSGRAMSAAMLLQDMGVSDHAIHVARTELGEFRGAMQGMIVTGSRTTPGYYYVDRLMVHPKIIVGEIPAKGVGTALMVHAAKLAADAKIGVKLTSLDADSDKFYRAIGMTPGAHGSWTWTAEQAAKIAAAAKEKADDFNVDDIINAGIVAETEAIPLAGMIEKPKSKSVAGTAEYFQIR